MNIAIIGSGGVGGYFGGKLAKAGNDVTFLARGSHMSAMKATGLHVKSINGNFTVFPAKVTDKIKDLGQPDLVIMSVKAWQVSDLAVEIKDILGPRTIILPLQNGVMAIEELSGKIHKKHIIGGLCRIFSMIEAPGIISHFGLDPIIVFGEADNSITPRITHLKNIFDDASITSQATDDIQTELWKKFIIICAGGILAITRSNYGEVLLYPELKEMTRDLLTEIFNLAVKAGAKVESEYVQLSMKYIDSYAKETTTSMARDIWAGKPSELEYQNGTVVKLGERFGVETPVNKFIYNCLLPQEMKARG